MQRLYNCPSKQSFYFVFSSFSLQVFRNLLCLVYWSYDHQSSHLFSFCFQTRTKSTIYIQVIELLFANFQLQANCWALNVCSRVNFIADFLIFTYEQKRCSVAATETNLFKCAGCRHDDFNGPYKCSHRYQNPSPQRYFLRYQNFFLLSFSHASSALSHPRLHQRQFV